MRKVLPIITILILISCTQNDKTEGPYIAKVENSVLSQDDAERLLLSMPNSNYALSDVVADWINREVLYLAAQKAELDNDETLNSRVDIYRKELYGNTFMDNYLGTQIKIEDIDISKFYNENLSMFKRTDEGAKIMHFFVTSNAVAQYIVDALKESDDSVDRKELLANYDAEVSNVEKGHLVRELDQAIFAGNRNQSVLGPIKTTFGYHVIEVLGRFAAGSQISLDEVYDDIYQRLFNQKKALKSIQMLDSLRSTYSVKINLEQYK